MKKSLYLAFFLAVVSISSALILSLVNNMTAPIISENAIAKEKENLVKLYSAAGTQFEKLSVSDTTYILEVYSASLDGKVIGYAYKVEVTGGYGGNITYLVGVNTSAQFNGFEPLISSETPSFGGKMNDAKYKDQYKGTSISSAIDGVSGATVTTTALDKGMAEVVAHYEKNYK